MQEKVKTKKEQIKEVKSILLHSSKIVFFGGAGVSTASGIPDFRGKDGLYSVHSKYGQPYEVMLSHSYYKQHTGTFFDFYKTTMVNKEAKPNAAHIALAQFEHKFEDALTIITQNIDGLHQAAGSRNVIEFHGSIHRNYCEVCHKFYTLDEIMAKNCTPHCECYGVIKPDVVLYGEEPKASDVYKAATAIDNADVLIVAGSSLTVYPAAGFVERFITNRLNNNTNTTLIIINNTETPFDKDANFVFRDNIADILPELLDVDNSRAGIQGRIAEYNGISGMCSSDTILYRGYVIVMKEMTPGEDYYFIKGGDGKSYGMRCSLTDAKSYIDKLVTEGSDN